MKLDLQAFEVKEILCKNSLMNRTDFTALLLSYELIVPQPKLFGMKVTFGLVASLVVPMIGALIAAISTVVNGRSILNLKHCCLLFRYSSIKE